MEYGKTLLDGAAKACGSYYKLHQTAGFAQGTISEIRKGKRALPLEWVPILADLCQIDPREALAECMCERMPEGKARDILGKGSATGAVAMLLLCFVLALGTPLSAYAGTQNSGDLLHSLFTKYTSWKTRLGAIVRRLGLGFATWPKGHKGRVWRASAVCLSKGSRWAVC